MADQTTSHGKRLHNLPVQSTPLVGRDQEVAAVQGLLLREDVRLLTLTGPGGVGKTRLGLELAADLFHSFQDGVFFVPLAPLGDPALVISAIAHTLDVREAEDRPLATTLQEHLRVRQMLLLLDNFEHLLGAAPSVADLLTACADLKILATSRTRLHLQGEHEFPVPPLTLPDPNLTPPVRDLAGYSAVALFVQRAQAIKADFLLTEEQAPAVTAVCRRLDGLPLAIELAAARVKLLAPAALLARLDKRFELLTSKAPDLPARQRTLQNAITWSYELLDGKEQALFRYLAVFAGGATLEAIASVCSLEGERAGLGDLLDLLGSLVDHSLLQQQPQVDGEPRFWMLETIREYAVQQLRARGEADQLQGRHAAYYLALAERLDAQLGSASQQGTLQAIYTDYDNFRAAMSWAIRRGEAEMVLRLTSALATFWYRRGQLSEGREWLGAALALADPAPAHMRARAAREASILARAQGDYAQARVLAEESLALCRQLGDKHDIAAALNVLGNIAGEQGDPLQATELYEESLALLREVGDKSSIAGILHNLGLRAADLGQYDRATTLYAESLALCQELGDPLKSTMALVLENWALVAHEQGNHRQAAALLKESLVMSWELGSQVSSAYILAGLAAVALAEGQPERATRLAAVVDGLLTATGLQFEPNERTRYDQTMTAARRALGDPTWQVLWAEGRAMLTEEAIAYALEPAPGDPAPLAAPPAAATAPVPLTKRQREVLHLLATGLSDKEIAHRLVISPRTVEQHVAAIYDRLDVHSRSEAVRWALQHGLG
jgi:predicted ATPase/DNA-binding CsgD family transcriptional regulator